ncbi:tol-pal system protein YbgF [Amphritea opalescens]|uniref:Cell division coordinator CpoB n=1 Tax=Amphritea opalescens TaxID=2490544 RepID=A0A430KQ96_9GAMM|nr:tol-pal system protein YbgF [Amphritea opalescens]RTE65640.1 tol-pal system protein YbgF [Amphritea opalescens]
MRKAYSFAAALVLFSTGALAADPVKVIELQIDESSANGSTANSGYQFGSSNDTAMLLQQLQEEVRSLRGMVEQQQYQLRQMEQQQRDRYRDLDRRIAAGQSSTPSTSSSLPETGEPASTSSSTTQPLPAPDSTPTDAQAYQQAFGLVRQKDFPAALDAFDKFIELYPNSARLPNAYYWVGEVNLAEQKLAPAKAAFEQVLQTFPQHRKAADASYKLGVIYHQMGEQAKAKEMFNNTISRYPESSAANLARDYLKR